MKKTEKKEQYLKVLSAGYILTRLGRQEAQMVDVLTEFTKFIGVWYG